MDTNEKQHSELTEGSRFKLTFLKLLNIGQCYVEIHTTLLGTQGIFSSVPSLLEFRRNKLSQHLAKFYILIKILPDLMDFCILKSETIMSSCI